jgi:hypothetical protein
MEWNGIEVGDWILVLLLLLVSSVTLGNVIALYACIVIC